jgi:ElaB/YqjD/DUF883 family membrane-anchored ribosome-binding protein
MPYLRPRWPAIAYGPVPTGRAAGVLPPATQRTISQVGGLLSVGTEALSSIDQYLRNINDIHAQENLFEVTSTFQAEQVAQRVSSQNASNLLRILRARIDVAASNTERQRLQQEFDKWTEVQRLASEREAFLSKVAWGIGIAAALALVAGGGWYYYRSRTRG